MKATVEEWVAKAEADYAAALLLHRSRKKHSRDIVCFPLQQCLEKYLKARLEEAGIVFPRTHDLEHLLVMALPVEPMWSTLQPTMAGIADFAVEIRYPGRAATAAEARRLVKTVTEVRGMIRDRLGLK